MNVKRVLSGVILFPFVALLLIFGNKYVVDILVSIVAIMSLHEFYKAFKGKANPIQWIGYLSAVAIAFIHIIPSEIILKVIAAIIPTSLLVLFVNTILNDLKTNITDIAITFFGICYIVIFLMFIPIIRENLPNGKMLIWFVLIAAWGTDVFAYYVGKNFGKHKFTQISPNKTIEGCIGGAIGAAVLMLLYAFICNQVWNLGINYLYTIFIAILLSVVGQIGDLSASSIKRYVGIKDFSNLIPGHGGMLDRIDSVIFIAPFAYFLLTLL